MCMHVKPMVWFPVLSNVYTSAAENRKGPWDEQGTMKILLFTHSPPRTRSPILIHFPFLSFVVEVSSLQGEEKGGGGGGGGEANKTEEKSG